MLLYLLCAGKMSCMKDPVNIDDLAKLDIRVGTVVTCEKIEKSDKLLKLEVDFGELGKRQILTGMAKWYSPQDFIGLQTIFLVNLKSRKMMGEESQGMILALGLTDAVKPTFLVPSNIVENGEGVR